MYLKKILTLSIFVVLSCSFMHHEDKGAKYPLIENEDANQEKQYVAGSGDIPLFSGLELIEADSSSFDTMVGSITISKYSGEVQLNLVRDFYFKALPQLGWKLIDNKKDKISFKREKDKLEIRFHYVAKVLYVKFFISSIL